MYSVHRFKQDVLNYGMLNDMPIHFKSSSTKGWLRHDSGSLEIWGITYLLNPSLLDKKSARSHCWKNHKCTWGVVSSSLKTCTVDWKLLECWIQKALNGLIKYGCYFGRGMIDKGFANVFGFISWSSFVTCFWDMSAVIVLCKGIESELLVF